MNPLRVAARALLILVAASRCAFPAIPPDPVYQALRQAVLANSFVAENIVLHRDVGTLTLKSGTIGFTAPVNGRETVAVFSGTGEFTLTLDNRIERAYLGSLTGQESVSETFDRVLLCFTDETAREIHQQAKTAANSGKLDDILREFRKHLREATRDNIEADLAAGLYAADQPGFFRAYLHGGRHADLEFQVTPRGARPSLGPEEVMLVNVLPDVPDEIWYHAHLRTEQENGTAASSEDHRTVAAQNYRIETVIGKNGHLAATTVIRLRALAGGERVVPLELLPTLRVSKVTADGQDTPFIQEDKKQDAGLYIVLPRAMEKDSAHEITVEYEGDHVVRQQGGGNFAVGARESWYPNLNTFHDHVPYELTFRVPKNYTLVSVGKLAREWTEQDSACSRWISETPLAVAGFNFGTFKKRVVTDPKDGAIEGYATSETPDYLVGASEAIGAIGKISAASLLAHAMVDAQNSLRIYNLWFGKSEFDRIAITQQPQFNFGQSWPTLVYLPMAAFLDATQLHRLMSGASQRMNNGLNRFVEEVTAHEVSHQWWGHMVGWSTYHDQWLSEGFADFSAALFLQNTEKTPDKFQKYWENARRALVERNQFGRRANDAGPIWLGVRLGTEKNASGYQAVVYDKGGYVLHMLRQMMFNPRQGGDQAFMAMMQDFVRQNMNQNATTEGFQRVVEQHMTPAMNAAGNGKMDWFFSEWIYGTALPKYKFDYNLTPQDGGKFLLQGTLEQSDVPSDFIMLVPIYVEFDSGIVRLGAARMAGSSTVPVRVVLPKKPKRIMPNYFHDILEQ